MTTFRPGQGSMEDLELELALAEGAAEPTILPPLGEGLIVSLHRIDGLTAPGMLTTPFVFQAAPLDAFRRSSGYNHADYDALAGQFSRPSGRTLEQTSFATLFVDYNASWDVIPDLFDDNGVSVFAVPNPLAVTKELRRIMHAGRPFLLSVANPRLWDEYDLRIAATMRTLDVEERHGEVDARYVDVSFSEFRDARVQRFLVGQTGGNPNLPVTLLVRNLPAGRDTLGELAKFYYKDPSLWRVIQKANPLFKLTIASKPLKQTIPFIKNRNIKIKIPRRPTSDGPLQRGPVRGPGTDPPDAELYSASSLGEFVE